MATLEFTDETPMPFGKHKGEMMKNVPASYLLFIWDEGPGFWQKPGAIHDYIAKRMKGLLREHPDHILLHPPQGEERKSRWRLRGSCFPCRKCQGITPGYDDEGPICFNCYE